MSLVNDTSADAERVLIDVYRKMSFTDKWRRLGSMYRTARILHASGMRLRSPEASDAEIHADWLALTLGKNVVDVLKGNVGRTGNPSGGEVAVVAAENENLQVILEVVGIFSALHIPYAVGGSIVSSLLGKPRFTQDADITVEPFAGKETDILTRLGPGYYVSLTAVEQAQRERSSFNIIHTPSGFKIDVFIQKLRAFDESFMARRRERPLAGLPGQSLVTVSAEDIILLKLEWFRLGGGISDRQWSDILGVLQVQGDRLDFGYLEHWAGELEVGDLLQRARQESGLG